jgi:hypothetical protein
MEPITGELSGTNYGDNKDRVLDEGTYDYTLKATDSGRLAFKVQVKEYPELGESGSPRWITVEEKSKINGGSTLKGSFVASSSLEAATEVRFNFNREFLSSKVGYNLTYAKRN